MVFHGIDFDIGRLYLIRQFGVLSSSARRAKRLPFAPNHSVHNGDRMVSVALPPTRGPTHIFQRYIATKIGFVAEGVRLVDQGKPARSFDDLGGMLEGEGLVRDIPPSAITGIMVPRSALSTRISELPLELPTDREACNERIIAIFKTLKSVADFELERIDLHPVVTLINRSGSLSEVRRARSTLARLVQGIVERAVARKLRQPTATLRDMLDVCVGDRLVRYDNRGYPIYDA